MLLTGKSMFLHTRGAPFNSYTATRVPSMSYRTTRGTLVYGIQVWTQFYLLSQEMRLRISMKIVSKNTTRDNNKTQIEIPPLPMPIPPIQISINEKSRHFRLKLMPCMSIIWCRSSDPWICFLWIIAFSRICSKASNSNSFPQCGQSKSPDAPLSNSTSRLQCGHWMTTIG